MDISSLCVRLPRGRMIDGSYAFRGSSPRRDGSSLGVGQVAKPLNCAGRWITFWVWGSILLSQVQVTTLSWILSRGQFWSVCARKRDVTGPQSCRSTSFGWAHPQPLIHRSLIPTHLDQKYLKGPRQWARTPLAFQRPALRNKIPYSKEVVFL